MALKQIGFKDFKGASASHELGQRNILRGFSGSGKSRIKDAIAFLFCGTDSFGARNPTHLISTGQESMSVSITTDKSIITRTLTRKGNGTIKVKINDVDTTYTQTQFESMIGTPDVFLSAMIPGYLFGLTQAKRMEVLTEVLPKLERLPLVQELLGFELTNQEQVKYGITRRPDLVASSIAIDRRSYETAIAEKRGRIQQLKEMKEPLKPTLRDRSGELVEIDSRKEAWDKFQRLTKDSIDRDAVISRIKQENAYRDQRKQKLQEELSAIKLMEAEKPSDEKVRSIEKELKDLPPEPAFMNEVMDDTCSTCGQTVSPRHREKVRETNEKAKVAHLDLVGSVTAHNNEVRVRLKKANEDFKAVEKAYLANEQENEKKRKRAYAINLEIGGIVNQEIPEAIEAPTSMGILPFNPEERKAVYDYMQTYNKEWGAYESQLKTYNESEKTIKEIEKNIQENEGILERLKKMEEVFKTLPEVETKRSIGSFNTKALLFDGENVIVKGMPLRMLSSGEKMAVHLYFAYEIGRRMKRPHRLIFLDNADLMSKEAWVNLLLPEYDIRQFQYFLAHVVENQDFSITIE